MRSLDSHRSSCFGAVTAIAMAAMAPSGWAAVTVLDDFEASEGHFAQAPNFSGTSASLLATSTADRVTTDFYQGTAGEKLVINDDSAGNAPDGSAWRVRFLSGGGTPANNVSLTNNAADTSYVGFFLNTTSPGLEAGILIDDGAALERSSWQPIVADGQWHFYQWQFQNAAQWEAFAGTAPDGAIGSASVTIDGLFFRATAGAAGVAVNGTFAIDNVSYNQTGTIPEPSSIALGLLATVRALRRRRR